MEQKNALIICWDFPPHYVIGGRRWSKIAKSLVKKGFHLTAITSAHKNKTNDRSWISHEYLDKIQINYLKEHFLISWLNNYNSLFKFFKIRIAKLLLSILEKGTIFDKATGIESRFMKLAEKVIIENSVQVIFVTGAPFNLLYYTARLKSRFPEIKIVADYRDPWIGAQNYGMKSLSPARKQAELNKQNYVFEQVDYVTAPNEFLLEEIRHSYTGKGPVKAQFIEVSHAFDESDFINVHSEKKSDVVKIIYAGTLYIGIEESLAFLNRSLTYLKNKTGKTVELVFYTSETAKKNLFSDNAGIVTFKKPVGDKVFEEIANADFILILLSEHNKNYLTSKFFEFMPYNKPYIYIGPKGHVSATITGEKFGSSLESEQDLYKIINGPYESCADMLRNKDKYTFDTVTSGMLSQIGFL